MRLAALVYEMKGKDKVFLCPVVTSSERKSCIMTVVGSSR